MEKLWTLLMIYVTCTLALDQVEKRDFIPSPSMDVKGGWRVLKGHGNEDLDDTLTLLYEASPTSIDGEPEFLNSDEEFRINVGSSKPDETLHILQSADSLPVASSYIPTTYNRVSENQVNFAPALFDFDDGSKFLKPPAFDNLEEYSFYMPSLESQLKTALYKPSTSHHLFHDRIPQESAFRSYQQPFSKNVNGYLEPFSEYETFPKMLPLKKSPIMHDQVQLYEFDKSIPPLILSEEITTYERMHPIPPRMPPMPQKMNFLSNNINRRPLMLRPPLPPPSPPLPPMLARTKRIISKPNYSKRTINLIGGGFSKNAPIVRGRFIL